ncbi:MAG: Phosphoglycerate mutase [Frankiales bacterium]|nr:Phosphoglycerate mutase [Frankiales bacterium]
MTARIVLLRHGQTASNAEGRIQGQLDTPLNEVGLAQAEALGTVFAADPPAVVVTSDLRRARTTAQAVCEHVGLPLLVDARLRETFFGEWQGRTGDEVRAGWPEEYEDWVHHVGAPVGGETPAEVGERAVQVAREHLVTGGTLLLVTHGGTARALVGMLTELPVDQWRRLAPLGNTCWSSLVESAMGWRLERHNAGLGPLTGSPTGAL